MSFCEIVRQIENDKIEKRKSSPMIEVRLTPEIANELLSRGAIMLHEALAMLSGLAPSVENTSSDWSYLDPSGQDLPSVERLISDVKRGAYAFPMRTPEFELWCQPWLDELPESLQSAFDQTNSPQKERSLQQNKTRCNSAADVLTEVNRCMDLAISLLKAGGINPDPCQMSGSKKPFFEFMHTHSKRLVLAHSTLDEYLKRTTYRWSKTGGKRINIDNEIRRILALPKQQTD